MRIGFDLDGVLCRIDMINLHLMDKSLSAEEQEISEKYYYGCLTLQMNPELFLFQGDIYFIITGRHEGLRETTEWWVDKYCPRVQQLYIVGGKPWYKRRNNDHKVFHKSGAEKKADIINALELDIYIDDSPKVVETLRELCPNTKIIQYGGRNVY